MISLDLETFCENDIKKVGLDAYTAHPTFEVMTMGYRLDDGPLQHWQAHQEPFPEEARERLLDPCEEKWAFNAGFERRSLVSIGIPTPVEGWRCSMALAYMRGFTGGLGAVGEQMLLPLDKQKQKVGSRLIRKFCMPQRITRNQPHRRRDWQTDPDDWELFCEYNRADVMAEEAVRDRLLSYPTPDDEWQLYALDQRINDRGMPFDRIFAANVARMSEYRRDELLDQMRGLTGLENPNSQAELLRWLRTQGYPFEDIRENTVKRALALGLPCAKVLALRQWSAKTATKKAATALLSAGADDRIRHMFQFVGASRTGRWAGRLVQPQNLARTPKFLDPEKSSERLDTVTDLIRQGNYEVFPLLVEEPMAVFGGTMRGMFRASPGHMLHICDYSSIEAVGLAWAARCERMLGVFRSGRDIYRDLGVGLFKKPYESISSAERQICKPICLGAGYGLGPGRVLEDGTMTGLLAYADAMGVSLSPEEAVAAIRTYRDTYPEVVSFWWACGDAAQAVLEEGRAVKVGAFRFEYKKPFLLIWLPSGRAIYYYKPRMEMREIHTGKQRWDAEKMRMVDEVYKRNVLTVMGRNQRSTQWERIVARPSHLVENCIAAGTPVLTDRGWVAIERVRVDDRVWDGVEFVAHEGVVCQGRQQTIEVGGVRLTQDHGILVDGEFIAAGQLEGLPPSHGFDGEAFWSADGDRVCRQRRGFVVDGALRLRRGKIGARAESDEDGAAGSFLRLFAGWRAKSDAWKERFTDLCGVAFDGGPLPAAHSSGLSSLWRERHYGVLGMGRFRGVLSRYDRYLSARFDFGAARQQPGVRSAELRVGDLSSAGAQPTRQFDGRDAGRADAVVRCRHDQRHRGDDVIVSGAARMAGGTDVRSAGFYQSAVVYDILNAGSRHRFTVRGYRSFVVSNCVQALTRDILKVGLQRLDREGFQIVGHSHDEIIVESREGDDKTWERMRELMVQPIDWLPGFPINAAGWSGLYYRK